MKPPSRGPPRRRGQRSASRGGLGRGASTAAARERVSMPHYTKAVHRTKIKTHTHTHTHNHKQCTSTHTHTHTHTRTHAHTEREPRGEREYISLRASFTQKQ